MSRSGHLSVIFACDDNTSVALLALSHLPDLRQRNEAKVAPCRWAEGYLEALANRSGRNPGSKGGLSTWGVVGNNIDAKEFALALVPFFQELLQREVGGIGYGEHIMIFTEGEEEEQAEAYELALKDETPFANDGREQPLAIVHHEHLPFAWMQ